MRKSLAAKKKSGTKTRRPTSVLDSLTDAERSALASEIKESVRGQLHADAVASGEEIAARMKPDFGPEPERVAVVRDDLLEALVPDSSGPRGGWCGGPATTALLYVADEIEAILDAAGTFVVDKPEDLHPIWNLLFRLHRRTRATAHLLASVDHAEKKTEAAAVAS